MDWYLNTVANLMQIGVTLTMIPAAIRWIKSLSYPLASWAIGGLLAASVLVSAAALMERLGWLPSEFFGHKPEAIYDRHYRNEAVTLDDKEFFNCTFENVTLVYNGGYSYMASGKLLGDTTFTSNNKVVSNTLSMLYGFHVFRSEVEHIFQPPPK